MPALVNSETMLTVMKLLGERVGSAALASHLLDMLKNMTKNSDGFQVFQQCDGGYFLSSLIPEIGQRTLISNAHFPEYRPIFS